MKLLCHSLILSTFFSFACLSQNNLTENEKLLVKNEVSKFIKQVDSNIESVSTEKYIEHFLNTDELAVATQGQLITSFNALRDTITLHLSVVQKQSIKTIEEKIFVIDQEHAVVSTSKVSTITFKNGAEITMPYAWTLFVVKRNEEWKIAHIHN